MDNSETADHIRNIGTAIFALAVLTGAATWVANLFEADLPGACLIFGWLVPAVLAGTLWLVAWLMGRSSQGQP